MLKVIYSARSADLESQRNLRKAWEGCKLCPIGESCLNHVFGRGKLPAEVLFIGEAPGPQEDSHGYPFVGRSGELLDVMIRDSFRMFRPYSYFITNTILCFPADEDDPTKFRPPVEDEVRNCLPRLTAQLDIVRPDKIVLVGKVAAKIEGLVKKYNPAWWDLSPWFDRVVDIWHPSYILRQGGVRSLAYKQARQKLVDFLAKHPQRSTPHPPF